WFRVRFGFLFVFLFRFCFREREPEPGTERGPRNVERGTVIIRAGEVERLVAALGGDDSVQREAAVARLRVIGSRAVERLSALLASDAAPVARAAALEALIDSDDARSLELGLENLAHAEAD